MKKLILLTFITAVIFSACKKDETSPANNNNNNNNPGCADGSICFTLDGTDISKTAGGYVFADTFLFVKYEEGSKQLSIDIFGQKNGNYNVTDVRKADNARIYYFPNNTDMYMAEKGNLSVSEFTADFKISGTFSGTLYKYDNNNNTFNKTDSVVITNGSFTKSQLVKQP